MTKKYKSKKADCDICPLSVKCLGGKSQQKRIQINIIEDVVRKNHAKDGSKIHTEVLNLRQIWSEGSFAAQKAICL